MPDRPEADARRPHRPDDPVPWTDRTLLFVAGLHRSGTTQLHSTLATHPEVGALLGTDAPHDEGQHLQQVYPTARAHGGPGRFAFDPRSHLTEESALATPEAARQLFDQWSGVWPADRRVLIEKSPPTLVRTRFFQALYPDARFVVIVRHPAVTAMATQKLATGRWMRRTGRTARLDHALEHWFAAHRLLLEDLPHLRHRHLLRWEDLCLDPSGTLAGIADFAGLTPRFAPLELSPAADQRYLARWADIQSDRRQMRALRPVLEAGQDVADRFGYDLLDLTRRADLAL